MQYNYNIPYARLCVQCHKILTILVEYGIILKRKQIYSHLIVLYLNGILQQHHEKCQWYLGLQMLIDSDCYENQAASNTNSDNMQMG